MTIGSQAGVRAEIRTDPGPTTAMRCGAGSVMTRPAPPQRQRDV